MTPLGWLSRVARVLHRSADVAAAVWLQLGDLIIHFTDTSAVRLTATRLRLVSQGTGSLGPARLFARRLKAEAEAQGEALEIDPALLPRPAPPPPRPPRPPVAAAAVTPPESAAIPAARPRVPPEPPPEAPPEIIEAESQEAPSKEPTPTPSDSEDYDSPGF